MINISKLKEDILNGKLIKKDEAMELYRLNADELYSAADEIREKFNGDKIDLCSIINGKSGRCSENCRYCAQSAHFKTGIEEYEMLSYEDIKKEAEKNYNNGVHRFSIVTSGKGLSGNDFSTVVEYYKRLNNESLINLCASHGIISKDSLRKLKSSGVKRYHHNIETSKRFYSEICTTHSYKDRIQTILNAKEVGLEVCSGGIIGMGETIEDRIDMAFELRNLEIISIPINILMPIKGTPLESQEHLTEEEILKTIAIFRFINPKANIRLAGGRSLLSNYGEKAFKAGANATITGDLLTTCGNTIKQDINMLENMGFKVDRYE